MSWGLFFSGNADPKNPMSYILDGLFSPFEEASERHSDDNAYATAMQLCSLFHLDQGRSHVGLMKLFPEAVCGGEDLGAGKGTITVAYTTAVWYMPDPAHHAAVRHKGEIRKAI